MKKHSKVMTIANRLVAGGMSRPLAMIRAWVLIKMPLVETKVSGVTFGRRQEAIEHLTRYNPGEISIRLSKEQDNAHDNSAIAVVASVEGRGSYNIGGALPPCSPRLWTRERAYRPRSVK